VLTPSIVALVFCGIFAALWFIARTPGTLLAAVVWLLYAPYEFLMYTRVWCSNDCSIRVDLLLIWPLLLGISLAVPIRLLVRHRRSQAKG
jgi:hypothetical protein